MPDDRSTKIVKPFTKKVKERQAQLQSIREPAESLWESIIDIFNLGLTPWKEPTGEGEERGSDVYHTGPARHLRTCTDGIMGSVVSPHTRWFLYQHPIKALRDMPEVKTYYQECEEQMYYRYENSNFYAAFPSHLRIGLAIGNSMVIPEEDERNANIRYKVPHPRGVYWIVGQYGKIIGWHYKFKLTTAGAVEKFGEKNDQFTHGLKTAIENENDTDKFEFLQCVYRMDDRILKNKITTRPWMEYYIQPDKADDSDKTLWEKGYWTFPGAPWRFEKNEDEVYGRGLGHLSYKDATAASEVRRSNLIGTEKEAERPLVAPMELRGRIHRDPDGMTYVDNAEQAQIIGELYKKSMNYAACKDFEESIDQASKEWFSVDFFTMLSTMVKEKRSPPTATQILEMAGEKAILLISRIGRLNSESLDALQLRSFAIEYAAGRLPDPPGIILEQERETENNYMPNPSWLQVDYIGPLAQVQKRMRTVRMIQDKLAMAAPILEIDQYAKYRVKWHKVLVDMLTKDGGFSQDDIVSEEEYNEIIAQITEQQGMDRFIEQATKIAKVIPSLQKASEEGSPAGRLAELLS